MNLTCPNCNRKATQYDIGDKIKQGIIQCSYCETAYPIQSRNPETNEKKIGLIDTLQLGRKIVRNTREEFKRTGHNDWKENVRKTPFFNYLIGFIVPAGLAYGLWYISGGKHWLGYPFLAFYGFISLLALHGLLLKIYWWIIER